MNRMAAGGLVLTGIGCVGYATGLTVQYTGRAFSISAIMLGITLLAIGRSTDRAVGE